MKRFILLRSQKSMSWFGRKLISCILNFRNNICICCSIFILIFLRSLSVTFSQASGHCLADSQIVNRSLFLPSSDWIVVLHPIGNQSLFVLPGFAFAQESDPLHDFLYKSVDWFLRNFFWFHLHNFPAFHIPDFYIFTDHKIMILCIMNKFFVLLDGSSYFLIFLFLHLFFHQKKCILSRYVSVFPYKKCHDADKHDHSKKTDETSF